VGATARRGYALDADASQWQIWWAFNSDPLIRLKDAVHTGVLIPGAMPAPVLKPTNAQILGEVLPALRKMLDSGQRDMVSAALIALGKVGRDHRDFKILDLMAETLRSGDQEIRETGALAMGISRMPQAVDRYLVDLVLDNERGHRLVGRALVNHRTRAFAAYALGLIAFSGDVTVKRRCFEVLRSVLEDPDLVSRDLKVAAIEAIGLLEPNAEESAQKRLLDESLHALETYYRKHLGVGDQLIQAHVPPAIARLLGREGPAVLVQYYAGLFLDDLTGKETDRNSNDIRRSAVLALGQLAPPNDGDEASAVYSRALLEAFAKNRDRQARYFSLIALGQIGGVENRKALVEIFTKANDSLEKSWAALALGIHARNAYEMVERHGLDPDVDQLIGRTLHGALLARKNPEVVSAVAIALGLSRYTDAADDLRDLLYQHSHQDDLAGYLCVGLGLMGDTRSNKDITDLVTRSVRRPELLRQGAVALGMLGDKAVADLLQTMLVQGGQNLATMSAVASAMGLVGDRRSIAPLVETMFDESLTDLSRAFAGVALGGVADKEPLPWNSRLAAHGNYRASVETLTTLSGTGILDIL
jgi:HEAT repeat protein